ncbi:MAG: hypothetical protein JNL72_03025 [Flavipsychrobacter sp.]|nr:hypothetical protein [Flavipsychrobacter sp.]
MLRVLLVLCSLSLLVSTARGEGRDPLPVFGTIRPDTTQPSWEMPPTTIVNILSDPELHIVYQDCTVLSYEVSIRPANGDIIGPFKVRGSKLDEALIELIKKQAGKKGQLFLIP